MTFKKDLKKSSIIPNIIQELQFIFYKKNTEKFVQLNLSYYNNDSTIRLTETYAPTLSDKKLPDKRNKNCRTKETKILSDGIFCQIKYLPKWTELWTNFGKNRTLDKFFSSDKSDEIFWRWLKFCPTNNLVQRKISPTFFCPIGYINVSCKYNLKIFW